MKTSQELEEGLERCRAEGLLEPRTENNPHLKVSFRGLGDIVPQSWNVKIYTSGTVVTTDGDTLRGLIKGTLKPPDLTKIAIRCDDAGWGFPLLGVMVGVEIDGRVEADVVDVSWFRGETFKRKGYLSEYAKKGWGIIRKMYELRGGVSPQTHRVEICTGCVNDGLKALLKFQGFDVRGVKIEGVLQDDLEIRWREYVLKTLGVDLAFDPKKMASTSEIAWRFKQAERWGFKYAPQLMKWK